MRAPVRSVRDFASLIAAFTVSRGKMTRFPEARTTASASKLELENSGGQGVRSDWFDRRTGSVIAKKLLAQGKKVRVVGRSANRLSSLVALGAEPFTGDISSKEAVARAFSDAKAAYVMIPPDLANPEYAAYQDKVTEAVASAL
jgi:hypothetical protein